MQGHIRLDVLHRQLRLLPPHHRHQQLPSLLSHIPRHEGDNRLILMTMIINIIISFIFIVIIMMTMMATQVLHRERFFFYTLLFLLLSLLLWSLSFYFFFKKLSALEVSVFVLSRPPPLPTTSPSFIRSRQLHSIHSLPDPSIHSLIHSPIHPSTL